MNQVSSEVLHYAPRVNNLNPYLLYQIELSGVEVEKFETDVHQQGAKRKNPIEKMELKLTLREYRVARNYQKKFQRANKSCHARPTLIYKGLPGSAASTKAAENMPEEDRIEASRFIHKCYQKISAASAPRQISGFKEFKKPGARKFSRDLRLMEILHRVFEEELSIRNVEVLTGINHSLVEDKVKKICEVLLGI